MSFSLKDALAGGGAAITVAAFLLGNLTGEQVQPVDNIVPSSPASSSCPGGWRVTEGNDPHAGDFIACTSPEGRYIMRISDGTKTTLDQETGRFVDSGQFK